MEIFKHCTTLIEARDVYRKLAKEHYPVDGTGDYEVMQLINAAYATRLSQLKSLSGDIHKFNMPDGRIITMLPLKARHLMRAASLSAEFDDDTMFMYLLSITCQIDAVSYDEQYYRSLPLADLTTLSQEFHKHNFKKED